MSACQRTAPASEASADAVRLVRAAAVQPVGPSVLGLSGTVRARIEAPLAFQVGGRISARWADAGQNVAAGALLFKLDPADVEQAVRAAEADAAAAETAWRTAQAELARVRTLHAREFVSAQALERAELTLREAQSRRDAAQARLSQARNTRGYTELRAPAAGVLVDVTGQPGQVVAAGQPVAVLAQHGTREVEVYMPDGVTPPAQGEAVLADGQTRALRLREAAPMVEPVGRTRRVRYSVDALPESVALGSIVTTRFPLRPSAAAAAVPAAAESLWRVPLGALDERGQGARVWRLHGEQAQPVPVRIVAVDERMATVAGALQASDRVVALGTHLLHEGMKVRELAP
ncbi:efflux RND transporter periplasmic adaptor subunit [Tepidimonas charontis]|uniref:efflux RND transporter periplasmic adaptor subunit n=1 Tax=Tepidimonas charontis TaxID=2267262 RepID=UPI00191BD7C8|nr:efflux RND transporter periplasmic adaptor subunit [Tepidimonas charontis]